jgi:4-amino-4-deoxy-L-arabinose transferase-like glycosyltransferase
MKLTFELHSEQVWSGLKELVGKFHIEHFLLLYFAVHMLQIAFPSDGSMIFDEAHYIPASVATLNGIGANPEHPPLPKLIAAIGIGLLGNNWFGWRFPQVLMQIVILYLFYLIAKRFFGDPWALGSTMLLGLDTIFFIHGGALLVDMPMFLFAFLAFELYFRKHYTWSAISMGLAFMSRELIVFYFAAFGIYHIYVNRKSLKPGLKIGLRYTLIALIVMSVLWTAYDLKFQPAQSTTILNNVNANIVLNASGTPITTIYSTTQRTSSVVITNVVQHLLFMYSYFGPQGFGGGAFNYSIYAPYRYPINWILPFDPFPSYGVYHPPDPFNSPTYFRVDVTVTTGNVVKHYAPIWYNAQANLPVWYGFWPALIGLAYVLFRPRRKTSVTGVESEKYNVDPTKDMRAIALFILTGMVLNFMFNFVTQLLFQRTGFNYYFIYVLPFVALGLAFTWKLIPKYGKLVLFLNVLMALAFFIWFFPVHPMPGP